MNNRKQKTRLQRKRRSEVTVAVPKKRPKTAAERAAAYRARCRGVSSDIPSTSRETRTTDVAEVSDANDSPSTTAGNSRLPLIPNEQDDGPRRCSSYIGSWERATAYFERTFVKNPFGHRCNVCDRVWFQRDLRTPSFSTAEFLASHFSDEDTHTFKLCANCFRSCRSKKIPPLSKTNGYRYPPKPTHLPKLDPISERLVALRIPFMQIRRLRHGGSYGIFGPVINVPVDVDTMVRCLPRPLDDDLAFNVNLKKNLVHKSSYLSGSVKKSTVRLWLEYLVQQPLYKHYEVTVDWSVFKCCDQAMLSEAITDGNIEPLNVYAAPESELIHSMQQTLMLNEGQVLNIAPAQDRAPESLIFDTHAEELSFPAIYYGCPRQITTSEPGGKRATPYSMCTSEIRRFDRRGATPNHVLFMASKMFRFKVNDGIQNMFRCVRSTEKITRSMIEDRQFVERLIEANDAFLRSIPNSAQYWSCKKKDVFAMLRQLGKPTAFLTVSANEIHWPHLLRILHDLSDDFKSTAFEDLKSFEKAHLVAEDPVTCAIYFHKLVLVLMSLLTSKKSMNPFGRYRVLDYFLRIEFQHRGAPHAHILLWLDNDPSEEIGENMPLTVQMITDLCSVDENDLKNPAMISNQTHAHTFTCTKRGESQCRFNIPYWPMDRTRILLPLSQDDRRRELYKQRVKDAREKLAAKVYDSLEAFMEDVNCDYEGYLDLIRSTLKRPTIIFKRKTTQVFINTFHPWIASIMNSNMDLQIILDPYSCATYVVDYVNKSNRGMSNLHRELLKIHEQNPEFDQAQLMSKVGIKILNNVEMPAQEAAWFLLRQPMSWASRTTVAIPTMAPQERYKARKRKSDMDAENLAADSTDIWTKSIIERYEERELSLEALSLAQFVAWYTPKRSSLNSENNIHEAEHEDVDNSEIGTKSEGYTRRKVCKIIRYRNYEKTDLTNYKREMVTLHVPFRNELVDVLDRNKFLEIYDANEETILEKRKEFEANIDIETIMREIEAICEMREQIPEVCVADPGPGNSSHQSSSDDLQECTTQTGISAIKPRSNVMSKEDYCALMRLTNAEQRELVLEVIYRLHEADRKPLQLFLTGPAGCGKTFLLKILQETYNRYLLQHNSMNNAYIATATTGKAAVGINGVTVHAAFRLTTSRQSHPLSDQILNTYRNLLRNVACVIIDEISMCSSHIFNSVNSRLQSMTGNFDENFGGLDLIACGDLKQLPPVRASPVFCAPQNSLGNTAVLWQSLDYFPLIQVVRQTDTEFSSLLTKIGSGKALTTKETTIIESRFRTRRWCDENLPPKIVRLYFNNQDVDNHNARAIPITDSTEQARASDDYKGYKTEKEKREAVGRVHRMGIKDTGCLPYIITLTKGYPYMLTTNIDVEDGLVNGAIGELCCVEAIPTVHTGDETKRVWLKFESEHIGRRIRLKYRAHVRSKLRVLDEKWVPIELRAAKFNLPPKIVCTRRQFPMIPAMALTIHRSQGGTFDQIIYDYHKNHQQQLVYVALSRVTELDGLFITNATDDPRFYHAQGSASPSIKEVQNEYKRLAMHRLPTITQEIKQLLDREEDSPSLTILNINIQSHAAHAKDLATDSLLSRADLIVATETWTTTATDLTPVDGFETIQHSPCTQRSGGVALFKRDHTSLQITALNATPTQNEPPNGTAHPGDIIISQINPNSRTKFILVAVYIHNKTCYRDLESFLTKSLREYGNNSRNANRNLPMILMGDFNTSDESRGLLEKYLKEHFRLKLNNDTAKKTTLGGTCLDLTFSRNMELICEPYIAYFSYHRPVFNKIIQIERM